MLPNKLLLPPKMMGALMKVEKVETVRMANKDAEKEANRLGAVKKAQAMRTPGKSVRFLKRQDEKIAIAIMDMLP